MGLETAKAYERRLKAGYFRNYLFGYGIDIGCGTDILTSLQENFKVDGWDWEQGDAQLMASVPDNKYDFVYSSHCLEHMVDPIIALRNWTRICKPGGYIFVAVPDEDLYEQGVWPSRFNGDHKTTWTVFKDVHKSWSPVSHNVLTLPHHVNGTSLIHFKLEASGYNYDLQGKLPAKDQSDIAEIAIEFILQKEE